MEQIATLLIRILLYDQIDDWLWGSNVVELKANPPAKKQVSLKGLQHLFQSKKSGNHSATSKSFGINKYTPSVIDKPPELLLGWL